MKTYGMLTMVIVISFSAISCSSIPEGAEAVTNFDVERYLGTWYEIARMDFRFERGLDNTTATYTLNPDGSVKVDNRGRRTETGVREQAMGKAKFVGDPAIAMLRVSFFGPFYGGYNVIRLDKDYQYALIAGSKLKYLWILSRTPTIPDDVKNSYLATAKSIGYKTDELIWVYHGE